MNPFDKLDTVLDIKKSLNIVRTRSSFINKRCKSLNYFLFSFIDLTSIKKLGFYLFGSVYNGIVGGLPFEKRKIYLV